MTPLYEASSVRNPFAVSCFSVVAATDPSVMPRVLEAFSKLGLVPTKWHSVVTGRYWNELHIDIQMTGLGPTQTELLAQSLRRIVFVDTVLTSEKRELLSA